jgi:hypothetical protein
MRFCPVCTQSYSQEFNRCPQCAVMLVEAADEVEPSSFPDGLEVVWSLSHVAAEVNRVCTLVSEQGISVSITESDLILPWPRWKEMSEAMSFPNDVRNVRLLVATEDVDQAQRIIEEATGELPLDDEELEEPIEEDEAEWRYEPDQEIGDMGGPPLADR